MRTQRVFWFFSMVSVLVILVFPFSRSIAANWMPHGTVKIIVPNGAGGGLDMAARAVQKILQERKLVNVPVVVINRPGGGEAMALNYLSSHAGDGNYLMIYGVPLLTSHILGRSRFMYSDFTPIAQLFGEAVVFAVRSDSPLKTAKDFVEQLKHNPSSLSMSIGGALGNQDHMALAMVMEAIGGDVTKLKTVVFKSGAQSMEALLGKHIDMVVGVTSTAASLVKAGKVRVIAVCSNHRLPDPYANAPTWRELGVDVVSASWRGILGPHGLSSDQIAYWDKVFSKLVKTGDWQKYVQNVPGIDDFVGSKEIKNTLNMQYQKDKTVLNSLGLAK